MNLVPVRIKREYRFLWSRAAVIFSAACGLQLCFSPLATAKTRDHLMISRADVVTSERALQSGPWSFIGLVDRLRSNSMSRERWLQAWLSQWELQQDSNGLRLEPRSYQRILHYYWSWENGAPIWSDSPFHLVSIVFRLDLRASDRPAGEGRFIFVLADPVRRTASDFFVIFEYRLPTHRWDAADWATQIQALAQQPGLTSYLKHLQSLTDEFTREPQNLLAIRTNDFDLDDPWELRNFSPKPYVHGGGVFPVLTPDSQTPHLDFESSRQSELIQWIESNPTQVMNGKSSLPMAFRTSASIVPHENFKWLQGSALKPELRRAFSTQTCNGCHAGETQTRFSHVFLHRIGGEVSLSPFLEQDLAIRVKDFEALLHSRSSPAAKARQTDPRANRELPTPPRRITGH